MNKACLNIFFLLISFSSTKTFDQNGLFCFIGNYGLATITGVSSVLTGSTLYQYCTLIKHEELENDSDNLKSVTPQAQNTSVSLGLEENSGDQQLHKQQKRMLAKFFLSAGTTTVFLCSWLVAISICY